MSGTCGDCLSFRFHAAPWPAPAVLGAQLIMRQKAFLDDVDCNLATAADAAALAEWTAATKRELLDRVPDGWAKALLQRLLAKDPLDRPPSMALVLCHPLLANAFRREAPPLTSPGEKHHFFISHFQKNAGPTCMALKMAVCSAVPGAQVWFDQDVSNKTEQGMMAGVAGSRFFLMFLSREVFARPFVQKEVAQALKLNKPIIIVRATDDRRARQRAHISLLTRSSCVAPPIAALACHRSLALAEPPRTTPAPQVRRGADSC